MRGKQDFILQESIGETTTGQAVPQGKNQRWSLDFVSDALIDRRRFRVLALADDFTRECLALVVDSLLSGVRVVRELKRLADFRGLPLMIVSDNGAETHLAYNPALAGGARRSNRT